MTYENTRVLQNWQPSQLDRSVILTELVAVVESHLGPFKCTYWTIRDPSYESPESNLVWHYDDLYKDFYSVVWSNVCPTEFQGFQASSGDIILIRNLEFRHRTPPNIGQPRWFAQFYEITSSTFTKLGKRFQ